MGFLDSHGGAGWDYLPADLQRELEDEELEDEELEDEEPDAHCCPDPGCGGNPCTFPGYAANH